MAHGFPIAQWAAEALQVKVYNVKGLSHWGLDCEIKLPGSWNVTIRRLISVEHYIYVRCNM